MKTKNKKTLKKIFLSLFASINIFFISYLPAYAIHIPTPNEVASALEARYHINTAAVQNIGESMNVADTKTIAPQVMIFFTPADPKDGEKVTAKANPMYFTNPPESLYYTWYIKRKGGSDDEDDWKIEASRIIANNGYDTKQANYSNPQNDNDGYQATFGGDRQPYADADNAHCYVHDFSGGLNYELIRGSGNPINQDYSVNCSAGEAALCGISNLDENLVSSCTADSTRTPTCSGSQPACDLGKPMCITGGSPGDVISNSQDCDTAADELPTCSIATVSAESGCRHLFANATSERTGDDSFGTAEEKFWRTNPEDPDTADNGNRDEANVVGLGRDTFTWNYRDGDKVGVAVEGVSMVPTKYQDASYMIMWALPLNDCPVQNVGSKPVSSRGYAFSIPTVDMNLNDCLSRNLADPKQKAYENIDLSLTASPDSPINDSSGDEMGDTINAQAVLNSYSGDLSQIKYTWAVDINNSSSYDDPNDSNIKDITNTLVKANLIGGPIQGIGMASFNVKLNLNSSNFGNFNNYFKDGTAYLRVRVEAADMLSGGAVKGKSDVIIKIFSSGTKIKATIARASGGKLSLGNAEICSGTASPYEKAQRYVCYVTKNQIVALNVKGGDFSNYLWTLNQKPLECTGAMSSSCNDTQSTGVNFFPVTGNVGDAFTVGLKGSDENGNVTELNRTFEIIDPFISIESADNNTSAWPKYLGSYQDLNGKTYDDLSQFVFKTYSGNTVMFQAVFHPAWIEGSYPDANWSVNGTDSQDKQLSFSATDLPGAAYNIAYGAHYSDPNELETRKALNDIWGISQFDSSANNYLSATKQIEVAASPNAAPLGLQKQFLAALFSNTPNNVIFLIRIVLTMFIIMAASKIVFSFEANEKKYK